VSLEIELDAEEEVKDGLGDESEEVTAAVVKDEDGDVDVIDRGTGCRRVKITGQNRTASAGSPHGK
jgi:hypothetical protein